MIKKLKLLVTALCLSPAVMAQQNADSLRIDTQEEETFTFTESQLGADDDVSQNVTVIGSNRNVFANQASYNFDRYRFRAINSKYNEVNINGVPVNDIERGDFRYSLVGGLNNQTRGRENSLPFEDNTYGMTGIAGASNYNFRPSAFATGHRATLSGANRNYNVRAMYTYNSGVTEKGWAYTASLTYRWGNGLGFVDGTFYNSLSYFFGIEKLFGKHALSLVTWGNPTERGAQAASTDEMYWIANNNTYNPLWGYQNGKKRNSRVIKDFQPTALLTWDWNINDGTKLTTAFLAKYSMYSSSRLNYNNSTNPSPDYYSTMPSYFFNVWDPTDAANTQAALDSWTASYNYLKASDANRQVNWDKMYLANSMMNAQGQMAMYYLQRYHDDQLSLNLTSKLTKNLTKNSVLNVGLNLAANKGMHYQTLDDLLGAEYFTNTNTYVVSSHGQGSNETRYDLNDDGRNLKKGDRFGYDYNILVNKAQLWAGYALDYEAAHIFINGRIAGVTMQRDGKMRHGLAPDNSFGKGGTAKFLDGGGKMGAHVNLGKGNALVLGIGYELKAPIARNAFAAAQINNDFVKDLKNEKVFSTELSYQLQTSWLNASLNAFYNRTSDVTESSMLYMDHKHSFTYVSLSGIEKEYYGLELGMNFKLTDWLNLKALGYLTEAKYINNANVQYMLSEDGKYYTDVCYNKGMREGGVPLKAASLDLGYHANGWYIDLIGNYYDKVYLYYSPVTRYSAAAKKDNDGNIDLSSIPEQAHGKGAFMLNASIGKSMYLRHGRSLRLNLMLTNLLNNRQFCTGGMEQNRTDVDEQGQPLRTYSFEKNPKKFYANGINGMFMITYLF